LIIWTRCGCYHAGFGDPARTVDLDVGMAKIMGLAMAPGMVA